MMDTMSPKVTPAALVTCLISSKSEGKCLIQSNDTRNGVLTRKTASMVADVTVATLKMIRCIFEIEKMGEVIQGAKHSLANISKKVLATKV